MSTLSGIISAGNAIPGTPGGLGGITEYNLFHYGQVANVGPYQFVRTGWLQPYESRHAPLISIFKPWGITTGVCLNKTFSISGAYPVALVSNANYIHIVSLPAGDLSGAVSTVSQNVRWSANAVGGVINSNPAATTSNTTLSTPLNASAWGTIDACTFKGNVYIAGYNLGGSSGLYSLPIWTSNTGTYSLVNNQNPDSVGLQYKYAAAIASNTTTIIAVAVKQENSSTSYQPDMFVSTDGATWTARASGAGLSGKFVARFFWHPLLSVWYLITTAGDIYTSPDATTWTSRTAPSGMPTSIPQIPMAFGTFANTANAGFVSVSGNYSGRYNLLLKINSLTSYSILSFENENYPLGTYGNFALYYDGTQLVRIRTNGTGGWLPIPFVSTDDGVTWSGNSKFTICGVFANNNANTVTAGNTGYYNPTHGTVLVSISKTGPNNNVFAGMAGYFSYGGTTVDTSNYYISDITNVMSQTTPDFVGMPYSANPGLYGYMRTV